MGMSTHVVGFRPPDATWQVMKEVADACKKARVEIPYDVLDFFEGEPPDDDTPGMEVSLGDAITPFIADAREGMDVDLRMLPDDIHVVRFYNAY